MLSCEAVEVESTTLFGIKACKFDVGNIQTGICTNIETACVFIVGRTRCPLGRIVAGEYGYELPGIIAVDRFAG